MHAISSAGGALASSSKRHVPTRQGERHRLGAEVFVGLHLDVAGQPRTTQTPEARKHASDKRREDRTRIVDAHLVGQQTDRVVASVALFLDDLGEHGDDAGSNCVPEHRLSSSSASS